jgi:hypothetical protein
MTELVLTQIEQIAEQAAERAVEKFFAEQKRLRQSLDLDLDSATGIRQFRDDLRYLHDMRLGSEEVKKFAKKTGVTLAGGALLALAYWLWDIFLSGLPQHLGPLGK